MKAFKKFFSIFYKELIAVVLLAAAGIVLLPLNTTAAVFVFVMCALYIVLCFASSRRRKSGGLTEAGTVSSVPVLKSLVTGLDLPIMIINEDNRIRWFNKEFASLEEAKGVRINAIETDIFSGLLTFANLRNVYKEYVDHIDISTSLGEYRVRVIEIDTEKKLHYATIWHNRTDEVKLEQEMRDTNILVAHIVVDNSSEMSSESSDRNKMASVKINLVLDEWAKSMKAVLVEHERDKYVMYFQALHMKELTENRFEILDRVVTATMEDSVIPLTISIGVSPETGSLLEKNTAAQNALQSALQKGGAQAVVKTADGEVSYGGRNKAVQKMTKIRSRVCKDLLLHHIPSASNVLIMGHKRADFDSIASNIGIAKLVKHLGARVNIIADRNEYNIKQIFDALEGNADYDGMFVDKIYGQELLTTETLLIITDVSNPEIFESKEIYDNAQRVIVIDHHAIKEQLGEQVLQPVNIDPSASSASELVCEILELALPAGTLKAEEAQILMAGILLDTQNFSRDTGIRTFSACSYLRGEGADVGKAQLLFKSSKDEFNRVNTIMRNYVVIGDSVIVAQYDGDDENANKIAAAKAAERFLTIEDIRATFVLYSQENGINLSARSDGSINVINITKKFGGGGHFQSAGATFKNEDGTPMYDIAKAYALLKEAIKEYLEQ